MSRKIAAAASADIGRMQWIYCTTVLHHWNQLTRYHDAANFYSERSSYTDLCCDNALRIRALQDEGKIDEIVDKWFFKCNNIL